MSGTLQSVALSPRAAPWLAAVGGAVRTRAAWVFRRPAAVLTAPTPMSTPRRRRSCVRSRPSPRLTSRPDSRSDASPGKCRSDWPCSKLPVSKRAMPRRLPATLRRLPLGKCAAPSCLHAESAAAHHPPPPQVTATPPSRATERRVTDRLTITPLLLCPGELTAPPVLLRSRCHSEGVADPPASVRSLPPRTRAAPPRWAVRSHSSGPRPAWPVGRGHRCASRPRTRPRRIRPSGI
jgi:hypothetical protein